MRLELGKLSASELATASRVKRLVEKLRGDVKFRAEVESDGAAAIARTELGLAPDEVRLLWDRRHAQQFAESQSQAEQPSEIVLPEPLTLYSRLNNQQDEWSGIWQVAGKSTCDPYRLWRQRQMARTRTEIVPAHAEDIVHAAAVFELSKGCSVGCWFCAISAPKLTDHFFYTPENSRLWNEILEAIKAIHGPAAGSGFCYWASDPMDNPDYEQFCRDFHRQTGNYPQTTTALPLKDPARLRRILRESYKNGCLVNRFSILTTKVMERVHQEYTPEELAYTQLVLQMSGLETPKARAGRAAEKVGEHPERYEDHKFQQGGTIACVSGFLFNMVERSVKLISPCNASERWPLGYRIYEQGRFETAVELHDLLTGMIERHMPTEVRADDIPRFRPDLTYTDLDDGFQVATRYVTKKYRNDSFVRHIGRMIDQGQKTADEIARSCMFFGAPRRHVYEMLNTLLADGILDEEPKPPGAETHLNNSLMTVTVPELSLT